jgi:LuxR family transcriptional regulator, maltose regulon positive regulatory protein
LNLKTQTPEISPFTIYRHHLIQTLKSNASKRLILVVAAGGWGKSTLLASYARTLTCPFLWYNMDPSDRDPAVFSPLLSQGLFQIIPQEKKALVPPLMALNRSQGDATSFFRHLFNALLSHPSEQLVLFFDDFHLAGSNHCFNAAFQKLIEKAPLNLHLIIISREKPCFLRSIFSDEEDSITLTAGELKFNPDEIELFFKQNYDLDLFQQDVKRIERQTDGWPVGLRLASQKIVVGQGDDHVASLIDQRINAEMVDHYFQEQFESGMSEDLGHFLKKAAIFKTFSPQLCEAVLGWTGADETLERMANTGLFVIRLDPQSQLYRYHHLFRQFLLDRLADDESEAAIFELHKNAATCCVQQQQWREAASHFIMAKAYQDAAIILKKNISSFISNGSAQSLLQLLEQIPVDVIKNHVALLYAHGWALFLLGRWKDANKTLRLAKQKSLINREMLIYGQIVQLLMFLNFSLDDFNANQQLAGESHQFLSPQSRESVLIDTQLAISLMQLGQPAASLDVWKRSRIIRW